MIPSSKIRASTPPASAVTTSTVTRSPATTPNQVSVNITHDAGTLTIVKDADVLDVAHGGTVTYTFDVTYLAGTDGSPAQNISVSDAAVHRVPCRRPDKSALVDSVTMTVTACWRPDETWRYTCSFLVPAGHSFGEEDPILNTASVSGEDLDGDPVTGDDSDQVSVNITHDAGTLHLVKLIDTDGDNAADAAVVGHGDAITWLFEVTYTEGGDGSPAQNPTHH